MQIVLEVRNGRWICRRIERVVVEAVQQELERGNLVGGNDPASGIAGTPVEDWLGFGGRERGRGLALVAPILDRPLRWAVRLRSPPMRQLWLKARGAS